MEEERTTQGGGTKEGKVETEGESIQKNTGRQRGERKKNPRQNGVQKAALP